MEQLLGILFQDKLIYRITLNHTQNVYNSGKFRGISKLLYFAGIAQLAEQLICNQ